MFKIKYSIGSRHFNTLEEANIALSSGVFTGFYVSHHEIIEATCFEDKDNQYICYSSERGYQYIRKKLYRNREEAIKELTITLNKEIEEIKTRLNKNIEYLSRLIEELNS